MAKSSASLERRIDELYQLPLEQFIGARNALAKALKDEKKDDAQATVRRLAKPKRIAWAVNQLYWNQAKQFQRLRTSAQSLLEVQQGRRESAHGKALEAASKKRRTALDTAVDWVAQCIVDSGGADTAALRKRIETTLEALALRAPGDTSEPPGRWTEELEPVGFDALLASVTVAPSKPAGTAKPASRRQSTKGKAKGKAKARSSEDTEDERKLEAARQQVERLQLEARRLQDLASEAHTIKLGAAARVQATKRELERAVSHVKRTREQLRRTTSALKTAEARAKQAAQAAQRAKKQLERGRKR